MALSVFHRDNVKAFIYFEKGSIPTSEEMINAFANFLHLSDEDHVTHHIYTQGRLTQGMPSSSLSSSLSSLSHCHYHRYHRYHRYHYYYYYHYHHYHHHDHHYYHDHHYHHH